MACEEKCARRAAEKAREEARRAEGVALAWGKGTPNEAKRSEAKDEVVAPAKAPMPPAMANGEAKGAAVEQLDGAEVRARLKLKRAPKRKGHQLAVVVAAIATVAIVLAATAWGSFKSV